MAGYFTTRGAKVGVVEMNLLAVKTANEPVGAFPDTLERCAGSR